MSNSLTADIRSAIQPSPTGKTLYMTLGNDLRADDGIGPFLFDHLSKQLSQSKIINAGERPENILDEATVYAPSKIIIFDAADFSGRIGEIRMIPQDAIPNSTYSTHLFPIKAVASLLQQDTQAEIVFIGIQPGNMTLGETLSSKVLESAQLLIHTILELDSHSK
jgi:hydrogenase maturation protease HycI